MREVGEVKPRKVEQDDCQCSDPMILEKITEQQIRRNDCKDKVQSQGQIKDDNWVVCEESSRQSNDGGCQKKVRVGQGILVRGEEGAKMQWLVLQNVILDLADDVGNKAGVVGVRKGVFGVNKG